ncbi:MAG: sigma-70 family RNA polymerase sigma factor [Bacilli bacterium]|nr:sigma-70 family RNA polymerase sigma factor [Bacilli bacterium]
MESKSSLGKTKLGQFSMHQLYSNDVDTVPCLDSDKNRVLLIEVSEIISRLDRLFLEAGCDDTKFEGCIVPWISDKMEYCLKNCQNKEVLEKLKEEYNNYLQVSSKIIEGNLRLVMEVAKGYRETSLFSFEDMVQYGNLGLIRAVEKYSLEHDASFSTYARLWIKHFISRNTNGTNSAYRIPSQTFYDGCSVIEKANELSLLLGREVTISELSKYMGESIEKIEQLKKAFYNSISLDEDLYIDDIETKIIDIIEDSNVDVYRDGVRNLELQQLKEELMKRLTSRQFSVLSRYIGIDGVCYNLEEIASFLNISTQRTGKIKREAVKKLSLMTSFIDKYLY